MSDLISETNANAYDFDYLDKDEAIFLMSQLKGMDCTACPRYYFGCKGNYSRQESLAMTMDDWLHKHRPGTEGHICHKLRTIINLGEVERENLRTDYQDTMRNRLAVLFKRNEQIMLTTGSQNEVNEQTKRALESNNKMWNDKVENMDRKFDQTLQKMQGEMDTLRATLVLKEEQIRFLERVLTEKGGA